MSSISNSSEGPDETKPITFEANSTEPIIVRVKDQILQLWPDNLSYAYFDKLHETRQYGSFELTDAITPFNNPSYPEHPGIYPHEGYKVGVYRDTYSGNSIPVLMISATKDKLLPIFYDLIQKVGETVDVHLASSHCSDDKESKTLEMLAEDMDRTVLESSLVEHEDLLLNDGFTGIAVSNPSRFQEVSFDEHKLIIVYALKLSIFESVLIDHGLQSDPSLRFISEGQHFHSSTEEYHYQFGELAGKLKLEVDEDQD